MFQERITQGADFFDVLQARDRNGTIPTYFLATDSLSSTLWRGSSDAPLFSPTVSWNDATTGKFNFSISAAQSALLDGNGTYRCQVFALRGIVKVTIGDFLVDVTVSAGPGVPATLTYCNYQDMLAVGEWIDAVQDADIDVEGFYNERLVARNWLDWVGINNFRPSFIGNFGSHSTAAFGFGYVGWYRTLGPSPTIVKYFANNYLILRPQVIRACAHYAVSEVGKAQLGKNNTFFAYGQYHEAIAQKMLTGMVLELDINGDGLGEIVVPLGSTNPLQV